MDRICVAPLSQTLLFSFALNSSSLLKLSSSSCCGCCFCCLCAFFKMLVVTLELFKKNLLLREMPIGEKGDGSKATAACGH